MRIAPLRRDDIPELSRFLIDGFGVPATCSYFSHEVLAWKFFDGPSPSSGDSNCSLIARSAGRIIGHVGMCPRQLIVPGDGGSPVSTMHAIDWLGSATHPGSGALLMLKAFATSKTQFAVDASAQAEALFPRLGFEPKPKAIVLRKVLAPLHRLRATDQGLLRRWAGAAKDTASVWRALTPPSTRTIEVRPASEFTEESDGVPGQPSPRIVTCRRDHKLLNYLLRYPLSGFSGWTLHASGRTIGVAVLKTALQGRIRHGKIVECRLDAEDPSCWQAAVAGLIDRLRALSVDDVECYATSPSLHAALLRNGFAESEGRSVYIRDKQRSLPRDVPFGLSAFDADGAIL
jgi:hypothetical protein